MPISKLVCGFLLVNALFLTACNLPTPKVSNNADADENSATFWVQSASGKTQVNRLDPKFSLPIAKVFKFQACVVDRAHSAALKGHPFQVVELQQDLKTDQDGCLNWTEEVPFKFLSTPTYLAWNRRVKATGIHRGTRTVKFAINPWSDNDKTPEVLNLDVDPAPKLLTEQEQVSQALTQNISYNNALWVNDMTRNFSEIGYNNGIDLNIETTFVPQARTLNMDGSRGLLPLTTGDFNVKLSLIHANLENGKEVRRVLSESDVKMYSMQNANLFVRTRMHLDVRPTRGQLLLGIKMDAVQSPPNLGHFEGIFLMGEYSALVGGGALKLVGTAAQQNDFKIDSYVNSKMDPATIQQANLAADGGPSAGSATSYVKPQIEIRPVTIAFGRVDTNTKNDRQASFTVQACPKDDLSSGILRETDYKVTGFHQAGETPHEVNWTLDNNGCLNWTDSVAFKYYNCPAYIEGSIGIENKSLDLHMTRALKLNPWVTDRNFGFDLTGATPPALPDCKAAQFIPATLNLMDYSYEYSSNKPELDSFLNKSIRKKLHFHLDASVNFQDPTGHTAGEPLQSGMYLLKLAVVKNPDYYNQKTYVTSAETLVATYGGTIETNIEMVIRDLKAISANNLLLVELNPVRQDLVQNNNGVLTPKKAVGNLDELIDPNSGLYAPTFAGMIMLDKDSTAGSLQRTDSSVLNQYLVDPTLQKQLQSKSVVRDYISLGQQLQAQQDRASSQQTTPSYFATLNQLQLVSLKDAKTATSLRAPFQAMRPQLSDTQVSQVLNQVAIRGKLDVWAFRDLCQFWYGDYLKKDIPEMFQEEALRECLRYKPEDVFVVDKKIFVKQLGAYTAGPLLSKNLMVANSMTFANAHSVTNSQTIALNFGLGGYYKFLNFFSVGVSTAYTISHVLSNAVSNTNSISITNNISYKEDTQTFTLRFDQYEECAVLNLKPSHAARDLENGFIDRRYTPAKRTQTVAKGLLICTGEVKKQPLTRYETYYNLYEPVAGAHGTDANQDSVANFYMPLRGVHDRARLQQFMDDPNRTPENPEDLTSYEKSKLNNLDMLSMDGLNNVPGCYDDTGNVP